MAFSYLSELDDHTEDWMVRARVCRRWESINTKDGSLISLDMILVDEKVVLSDIVGCFTGFEGIETVRGGSKKRDIQILTDYSVNSTITLWGKLGEQFDPSLYTQDSGPYVIVVSSVTVKRFRQGSLTFATTSASKVYVNPEVDYVSSIKERFSALSIQAKPIEGAPAAKPTPEEEMFMNRMTVDTLVQATNAGEMKVTVVTLKATITAINSGQGWYYIACRSCVTKAELKDGVYVCHSCGPLDYPLALYRVRAEVQDATGTTTVVIFNYPAENLLDTSAKKLLGKMRPGDDSLPKELNTLLGREFVFKLKLDKYNLIEGLQDYRVSTVFYPVEELEALYAEKEARNKSAAAGQSGSPSSSANVRAIDNKRKRKLSCSDEDDDESQ